MEFKERKLGWKHPSVVTAITSSTGRHSPVIDLGGLNLCAIKVSTVGWTAANLSILGGINTTSTSSMRPIWGAKVAGSIGSTNQVTVSYQTTIGRLMVVDPRLTKGLSHIMLQTDATQATTRAMVLSLGE